MEDDRRRDVLKRLSYIEGHVSGIRKMVEEDKYCVDILRQTYAVRKALEKLEAIIKEQTLWKRQPLSPPTYLVSIASTPSKGALGELAGVNTVKVDVPTKTVNLTYDPQKVTLAKIEEVLDATGYPVAK